MNIEHTVLWYASI